MFRGPGRAVLSDGWRRVLYVNVPIGLIGLVLAARPASTAGSGSGDTHLDLVGPLLLGGGVLSLMLVVNGEMIGPGRLLWLYLAPVLLLVAFARWRSAPGAEVDSGCSIRGWRAPPATPAGSGMVYLESGTRVDGGRGMRRAADRSA